MGWLLVCLLAVALTTTGCSVEAPGQPMPGPRVSATAPSTSVSRTGEAPPFNSPELDLASYEGRVCDVLTSVQLAPLAIRDPGKPSDEVTGPVCNWHPPDTSAGADFSVAILSKIGYGLDGVYARKARWRFFEDAGEINGYPAVHLESTSDGTEGRCATTVGVRRDLTFEVGLSVNDRSAPEYKKPCSVSDRVASAVIDTIKGGR
jgi:hypothetical protein